MICENCGDQHDGSYASGRFCSLKCSRSFSTTGGAPKRVMVCLHCGHEFDYKYKKKQVFCSRECKSLHGRITVTDLITIPKRMSINEYRHRVKNKAIEYKGGKCIVCGYNKSQRALHFHHLNPEEKEFSIGRGSQSRPWEELKLELDKCVLVCANCHSEIHDELIDVNEYKGLA